MASVLPVLSGFRTSIVRRYFLVSVLGSILPMALVGALYDRYASALLDQITGERLTAQLTATASRLSSFMDVRTYQIETLSNHPALPAFVLNPTAPLDRDTGSLLRIEADTPDLYGLLFFNPAGELSRVVAGQAASGPPYWSDQPFTLAGLPVTQIGDTEIIGPVPPQVASGSAGWFLMRQPLRDQRNGQRTGSIALHVRLSSMTELLGASSLAGILQPVLKTPAGYFDTVGRPVMPTPQMVAGPEVLPGWQAMLVVDPDQLIRPFMAAREGLYLAAIAATVVIALLFSRLAARLRRRIEPLAAGAEEVSAGRLEHRILVEGNDEIGTVASAFNSMAARLRDNIARTLRIERLAALGEFATGVAHEVRNPLATIKTTVQALARSERDDERLELLEDVGAEIDRLGRVMDDLLAFGRPRPPSPAPVQARRLLRRVGDLLAAPAREGDVSINLQGDADLVLTADLDHLIQVLVNLGLNAIQASPPGSAVTLRISQGEGEGTLIEVSDSGGGIPAEIVGKVTDPFFTTRPKGTGLGLSISRQLVELSGGTLAIHSVLGQGTLIRISLPALPPSAIHDERTDHR